MSKEIELILRELDIIAIILILTGQITVGGVFLQTGSAFALSLSGPITGGTRIKSEPENPIGCIYRYY